MKYIVKCEICKKEISKSEMTKHYVDHEVEYDVKWWSMPFYKESWDEVFPVIRIDDPLTNLIAKVEKNVGY